MNPVEVENFLLERWGKTLKELSDRESAMIRNTAYDLSKHHPTPVMDWSREELDAFFEYLDDMGVHYENLPVNERWTLESLYTGRF